MFNGMLTDPDPHKPPRRTKTVMNFTFERQITDAHRQ